MNSGNIDFEFAHNNDDPLKARGLLLRYAVLTLAHDANIGDEINRG